MLMKTYSRYDIVFVSGAGNYVFDQEGRKYLDMSSGFGVNSIGYSNPKWVKTITNQAGKLAHISNAFYSLPDQKLAKKIADISGLDSVFFVNSGSEAIEAMLKMAFKYSYDIYGKSRNKIATLTNSYHGRTIATLNATEINCLDKTFCPTIENFYHIPVNRKIELQEGTLAVLIEIVQGAGGVYPLEKRFVNELQRICSERDILLLVDEVQTGFGRTGKWFAFQNYDLTPDAIGFAKGLGGGLPIGGAAANKKISDAFSVGSHDSTFGGNQICTAGALTTIEIISDLMPSIIPKGERIKKILERKFGNSRGLGLMIGTTIGEKLNDVMHQLLDLGVVATVSGNGTLRLLPPLTISEKEIDEFEEKVSKVNY